MQKSFKEICFPGTTSIARSDGLVEGGHCGKVSIFMTAKIDQFCSYAELYHAFTYNLFR